MFLKIIQTLLSYVHVLNYDNVFILMDFFSSKLVSKTFTC